MAIATYSLGCTLLSGCASDAPKEATLADLDVVNQSELQADVFVPHKTEEEIKQAYYNYINNARASEHARLLAISRLAEMEINKANAALKAADTDSDLPLEDTVYVESLQRTRNLLLTSLRDYPDDSNNDQVLYRLARIYDQLGEAEASLDVLEQLVSRFPSSLHYAEAQFRLAERAFVTGDYISAEDAYTEVIYALNNSDFRQRAYFKRGWARYKQGLYRDAAEDHLTAIREQGFGPYDALSENERGLFDEHFRALALTFAHIHDQQSLYGFFNGHKEDAYRYHACRALSDIYLKQERFSDAASVLRGLVTHSPEGPYAARAHLQVVEIWQTAKFHQQYLGDLEQYYLAYSPGSAYWTQNTEATDATQLKDHLVRAASHFHNAYLKHKKPAALAAAMRWYQRYLQHFSKHARKDNIHMLYGDLLASTGKQPQALEQYTKAAFDNNIILDKSAAYAAITLSYTLHTKKSTGQGTRWLTKHLDYSERYAQLFPNDAETEKIALHGAEAAFNAHFYEQAITLSNLIPSDAAAQSRQTAQLIKARALLETGHLLEAEELLTELLPSVRGKQKERVADNLALTLYKRGEKARHEGKISAAVDHYARITDLVPSSDIAPQGLYDAIVLAMDEELWSAAIRHMQMFEKRFASHPNADDVARRLSVAYLKSERFAQAAEALEDVSGRVDDANVQMAALWQAAGLYEAEGNLEAAVRTYRSYAHTYKRPFPQNMEAMYKLTHLYSTMKDNYRRRFWEQKIVDADRHAPASAKTDRTSFIAASAWLALARQEQQAFEKVKLEAPLAENLRRKKQHMEKAIELYSKASGYNLPEVSTESTYAIATTYRHFAKALLESERPSNLNAGELAQYNILIEDQAFPFEEMAIQFHEINVGRIAKGTVNRWVTSSIEELTTLFPVRYARHGKLAPYRERND